MSNRHRRRPIVSDSQPSDSPEIETDAPDEQVVDADPQTAGYHAADTTPTPAVGQGHPCLPGSDLSAVSAALKPWFGCDLPGIDIDAIGAAIACGKQVCILPAPLRVQIMESASLFDPVNLETDAVAATRVLLNVNRWLYDRNAASAQA
jgi:hypothetical protein